MLNSTPCPSSVELQRYLLGQIPDAAASMIDAHLEQCATCVQSLAGLPGRDPLLEVMQASGVLRRPRNPFIDGLVQKLAELSHTMLPQRLAAQQEIPSQSAAVGDTFPSGTELSALATTGPDDLPPARPADNPKDYLAPAQAPDEMGRLGGYRVLKVLGSGGMGVVFLAEDVQLKRRIALKVMRPSVAASPDAKQRFFKEARATAAVEHEHIIAIHQIDEDRGVPFLAMPLLQGETLEDRLRREPKLPLTEAVRIAREIAEGLAAAHDKNLIHRDIKPVNVWLTQEGRIKVLDFGLARSLEGDMNLTQTGAIVGTPAYMAPEQARGEHVDGRSDLFSLGCVLYRMVTGERPFKGGTPMSQLRSLEMDQPSPPHQVNPQVPLMLSDVVMRLLAKDPAQRLASARQVAVALQTIENELHGVQQDATYPIAIPMPTPAAEWSAILKIPAHWKKRLFTWQSAALAAGVLLLLAGMSIGGIALVVSAFKRPPVTTTPPLTAAVTPEERQRQGFQSILRPHVTMLTGQPLAPGSLVTAPAQVEGVETWTIESDKYNIPPQRISFLANGKVMDFIHPGHRYFSLENYTFIDTPARGNFAALSPDDSHWFRIENQRLAIGVTDKEEEPQYIFPFPNGIKMAAWHPDGKVIAVMSNAGKLSLCDAKRAGILDKQEKQIGDSYSSLAWSPDGKILAHHQVGGSAATPCQLIDPNTLENIKTIRIPEITTGVQWSPDSSMLAILGNSTVYVWQLDPLKQLASFHSDILPVWRPAGNHHALAYAVGNTPHLREVGKDKDTETFTGHKDNVSSLQFSPDGKTLISISSSDKTVRFWEAATGKPLATILYLTTDRVLVISANGYYTGSPGVEDDFLFVYRQEDANHTLTPAQFRKKFDWKNEPSRVNLFAQ